MNLLNDNYVIKSYLSGESTYSLGIRLGVSRTAIVSLLKRNGVEIRSVKKAHRLSMEVRLSNCGITRQWLIWQYWGLHRSLRDINTMIGSVNYANYLFKIFEIPRRGNRDNATDMPISERAKKNMRRPHNKSEKLLVSLRKSIKIAHAAAKPILKELWLNSEWKASLLRKTRLAMCAAPNKVELTLSGILSSICPNEYKYTGDGQVVIAGLIPDFTNCNGQKKVIELFGNYWHSVEFISKNGSPYHRSEIGRKEKYAEFGYDCLVIWEKEIKQNPELVKEKILQFNSHG